MKKSSVSNLRIYQLASRLEDEVYELAKKLPEDKQFPLGNNLRRGSAAVCHYINESHDRFSYQLKMNDLHAARVDAERMVKWLQDFSAAGFGETQQLVEDYTSVIKQAWGLTRWIKARQAEKAAEFAAAAKDELASTRS